MGETLRLRAGDGFELSAYRVTPNRKAIAGVVVAQEIFGVNHHIRGIADRLAAEGYAVIAPALFDRLSPGLEVGYDPRGRRQGSAAVAKASRDDALRDIDAARQALVPFGRIGVVGFCWGGTLAWLAATRLAGFSASVLFYGGIGAVAAETPRCPVEAHFGEQDTHIPMADVDKLRVHAGLEIFTYPAGHGFNCDERESYDRASATLAWRRTLAFLAAHL
jgi:carboxymethylenebutenolidase